MKKYLFAGVAVFALNGVARASDLFNCHLTDQRGNILDYTFQTGAQGIVREISLWRNNRAMPNNHGGSSFWDVSESRGNDANPPYAQMTSEDDRDWSIFFNIPAPHTIITGAATLYHKSVEIGMGYCTNLPFEIIHWSFEPPLTTAEAPPASPPPASSPASPPAPAPTMPEALLGDSVPLLSDERAALVMVGLGSQYVPMELDTGAEVMQVRQSFASRLIQRREAEQVVDADGQVVTRDFRMADGHTNSLRMLNIHTVTIGSHVLHDVSAAIVGDNAVMLLPFPVLNQIGKFTIDTANHKLTFE